MPFFMYQGSYTAESWAAQMKNPENRVQIVGQQACEAVGGRLVAGWYCFGEYDIMVICNVPNARLWRRLPSRSARAVLSNPARRRS